MFKIHQIRLEHTRKVYYKSNLKLKNSCTRYVVGHISLFLAKWTTCENLTPIFRFTKSQYCLNIKHWFRFWKFIIKKCFKTYVRNIVKLWIYCIQLSCINILKIPGNLCIIEFIKMIFFLQMKEKIQLHLDLMQRFSNNACLN